MTESELRAAVEHPKEFSDIKSSWGDFHYLDPEVGVGLVAILDAANKRIAELEAELDNLRETNSRLNRRCQQIESVLARNDSYRYGYADGCRVAAQQVKAEIEQGVRRANFNASQLGVKNKRLLGENARLRAVIESAEAARKEGRCAD